MQGLREIHFQICCSKSWEHMLQTSSFAVCNQVSQVKSSKSNDFVAGLGDYDGLQKNENDVWGTL